MSYMKYPILHNILNCALIIMQAVYQRYRNNLCNIWASRLSNQLTVQISSGSTAFRDLKLLQIVWSFFYLNLLPVLRFYNSDMTIIIFRLDNTLRNVLLFTEVKSLHCGCTVVVHWVSHRWSYEWYVLVLYISSMGHQYRHYNTWVFQWQCILLYFAKNIKFLDLLILF